MVRYDFFLIWCLKKLLALKDMENPGPEKILSDVIFRDYEMADYSAVIDLWDKTGLGGALRGDDREAIKRTIRLGGKLLVAVLPGGQLIGSSWMTYDGRRIHLHHVAVLPEWQRRGIGRRLTELSIGFAKETGTQIKLEVHQSNKGAVKLYRELGFRYLGDYDVYIMRDFSP